MHPNRMAGNSLQSYLSNSGTGRLIYIPLHPLEALIRLNRIIRVNKFNTSNSNAVALKRNFKTK